MKITFCGDSITVGVFFDKDQNGNLKGKKACPNYTDVICSEFKIDRVENLAQSGISYSATGNTFPEDSISNKCKRVGKCDVVVLAAGTNDLTTNVKLGKSKDKKDVSLFGAVDYTLKILKKKATKKIIVITPLHRENETNEYGMTLSDITDAIKLKCRKYDVPVICGFDVPFDLRKEEDRNKYGNDGLHPNTEAHKILADYIIEQIKKRDLFM